MIVSDGKVHVARVPILQGERQAAGVRMNGRVDFEQVAIGREVAGKAALESIRTMAGEIVLAGGIRWEGERIHRGFRWADIVGPRAFGGGGMGGGGKRK